MSERRDSDGGESCLELDRRSALGVIGAAGASAAGFSGASAPAAAASKTVVDLADEGLTDGDTIDPYLRDHWADDVELRVPAGTYEWNNDGYLGDATSNATLHGKASEGEIIFDTKGELDEWGGTLRATSGTVTFQNVTIRGTPQDYAGGGDDGPKSGFNVGAAADATLVLDNVNFPDGTGGEHRALYGDDGIHEDGGEIYVRRCYAEGWGNNAFYTDFNGVGGPIHYEDCTLVDNNISSIRIGPAGSTVRNCTVVHDAQAPENEFGDRYMRGIRVRENGNDTTIAGNHLFFADFTGQGPPVELHDGIEGSTGSVVDDCVIENQGPAHAINEKGSAASGWSGSGSEITGPDADSREIPPEIDAACQQATGCTTPDTTTTVWTPKDGSGGEGGSSSEIDSFDDGDLSEYAGDTGAFVTQSSVARSGSALEGQTGGRTENVYSTGGLPSYPTQGDTFECWVRTTGSDGVAGVYFAYDGSRSETYRATLDASAGCIDLVKWSGGDDATIASATAALSPDTWYRLEVDWNASDAGTTTVVAYDAGGAVVAALSVAESEYAHTGVGFHVDGATGQFDEMVRTATTAAGVVEDFESTDLSADYSFDQGASGASLVSSPTYSGDTALSISGTDTVMQSTGQLSTPAAGDTFSYRVRATGGAEVADAVYAAQDHDNLYWIELDFLDDSMRFKRYVDASKTNLGSVDVPFVEDEWFRLEVEWGTDGSHTVTLFDAADAQVGQLTVTDSTYTSGEIGFDGFLSDSGGTVSFDYVTKQG